MFIYDISLPFVLLVNPYSATLFPDNGAKVIPVAINKKYKILLKIR